MSVQELIQEAEATLAAALKEADKVRLILNRLHELDKRPIPYPTADGEVLVGITASEAERGILLSLTPSEAERVASCVSGAIERYRALVRWAPLLSASRASLDELVAIQQRLQGGGRYVVIRECVGPVE